MSKTLLEQTHINDSGIVYRIILLLSLGAFIAGGLTYFMHVLIESSQQELDHSKKANLLDFVRVKRDETSQIKQTKPKRPEIDKAPPAPPTPQAQKDNLGDTQLNVSVPEVSAEINVDVGGIGIGTGDGEYLPIVKIAPNYPIAAMSKGIEGECTVEYTVTTNGSTKDIKVVDGLCPRVFARSSVAAARKFKYKPRVEDGKAIEVPNIRNKFIFEFEEGEQQ